MATHVDAPLPEQLNQLGTELDKTRQESTSVRQTVTDQLIRSEMEQQIDPAARLQKSS